jgi:hypothetical protein
MLTAGLDFAVVVLPARSLTDAEEVSEVPSPEIVLSDGQLPAMPERASEHVQWTVTLVPYQPAPLGVVVGAPDRAGCVSSMLIGETAVVDELSALSTAVPVTDWPAPSLVTVVEGEHDLIPEGESEQVKLAVTAVLFQPLAFGTGDRLPVINGGDLSTLTVTEPLPVLPSRSVAVDVNVVPAVLPDCDALAGVGPVAKPEPASVADHVTVTLELFQPAALGAGLTLAVTVGPVLSSVKDAVPDPVGPVQFPLFWLKLGEAEAVTVWTPSPMPATKLNVQVLFAEALV